MRNYKIMSIGVVVDKSNAKNSSSQLRLAPTPYYKSTKSFNLKTEPTRRSFFQKIFCSCADEK